jgi:hypothetical protein
MADRDRRAIILGLAVLAPALLFVFVVKPYRAKLAEMKEQVSAERSLLERELALIAQGPTLPRELKAAEARVAVAEARLVKASNQPLAEAELTEALEEMSSESRVLLQEVRNVPLQRGEEPPAGMGAIRLGIRGESDLEGVATLLHKIENSRLVMRLREVSLEAKPDEVRARPPAQRGRPAPPPQIGVMQFTLVVESFVPLRGGEEEKTK